MNHGGIVYVAQDRIRLSEDLLRPLSIVEGTQLFGVYYPTPQEETHKDFPPFSDFMLTPIPYRSWPFAAGLRIELQHKRGTLATIASFLKDREINIISAQCNRSGHRYVTWNLVVDFEDLHPQSSRPSLERLEELATEVPRRAEELKLEIKQNFGHVLQEQTSPYLRDPVGAWALKALSYFYNYSMKKGQYPFRAICRSRDVVDIEEARSIGEWAALSHELPTLGFANLDTELFNVRIAILKSSSLHQFRSVSFGFSMAKNGQRLSSRGVLSSITEQLHNDWNIWRVYSEDIQDTPNREERRIQLFMECVDPRSRSRETIDREVLQRLESIPARHEHLSLNRPVLVSPISPRRIFVSIRNKNEFHRRDDVLAICRELAGQIGVLPQDVVTVENYTADSVTEEVAQSIAGCTGMLQFYMGTAHDVSMDWLNSEFFLACFLKIPRIRFVDPGLESKLIFQRDHPPKKLFENVSDQVLRAEILAALKNLDHEMKPKR